MVLRAQVAWLAGVLAGVVACGPSSRSMPTSPTMVLNVSAHVLPPSPTIRRTSGSDGAAATYALDGRVTFRVSGASRARLVSLDLELGDDTGRLARQTTPLDMTIEAGADATVILPATVFVATARVPTRLWVGAAGRDADDAAFVVPAVDVPVTSAPLETPDSASPVTFVGAGDIGDCTLPGAGLTARAVQGISGSVFTLGDHVYPAATSEAFASCYESTWGAVRQRTYPTPGNHEWDVNRGAPYLAYFGAPAARGFYSFDLGAWHVLSLNSNVAAHPGSQQYEWIRADLATRARPCTLAYWHHPLFSSGTNGPSAQMHAVWELLDESGVELVMAGHDHLYERFGLQDANGSPTPTGMRAFVVGTGGAAL